VLSNAIWSAAVTLVKFVRKPSRFFTMGSTLLMFMSAFEMPSTVPINPITGKRYRI
jgi:hypothetical protein